MNHTTDFLRRCYEAYRGAKVINPCDRAGFKVIDNVGYVDDECYPVLQEDWAGGTNPILSCGIKVHLQECKMQLTPISKITDEDAIAIAKMKYPNCDGSSAARIGRSIVLETDNRGNDFALSVQIIDFLRENHYDMGFGPLPSLIVAGLAIEEQPTGFSSRTRIK